jgi:molecular chaperone GrpE
VQRIESPEYEPGTVVTVMTKGYLFGGRMVRPAMVAVAVEPSESVENDNPTGAGGGEAEDAS